MTPDRTRTETSAAPDGAACGRLLVLTGAPGSGKTTRCRELAETARAAGLLVRGLAATVEPGEGGAERWLEDLGSGERRLLGRQAPPEVVAGGGPQWQLNDAALAWSNAILSDAGPSDLLIVDEVGPVELLHRRGALAGVERALARPYRLAVVVVRPWLVPRFLQLFPVPPAEIVDIGAATVLSAGLADLLRADPANAGTPRVARAEAPGVGP
jgi:nucleoside-triphosphatase THEP1